MELRLNGELEPCPHCEGEGLVKNEADEWLPCPVCKGSAVVDPDSVIAS